MIPIPKPKATIVFALVFVAAGVFGLVNPDMNGSRSGIPLPLLGVFLLAFGIYLIVGSVRALRRRG